MSSASERLLLSGCRASVTQVIPRRCRADCARRRGDRVDAPGALGTLASATLIPIPPSDPKVRQIASAAKAETRSQSGDRRYLVRARRLKAREPAARTFGFVTRRLRGR